MSSLLTETTHALGLSGEADHARTAAGVVAIAVLLAVLVIREMARAASSATRARRAEKLRFITVPLTAVCIAVIAPRIVEQLS